MTESFASSVRSENTSFQGDPSNSNSSDNHQNRKQKRRPMQTSSQDVRYSHRAHQQQQQRYPLHMYYDEYHYESSPSRGGYYGRNHHQQYQQQRRSQFRHPSSTSQVNQQETVRPNSNSSARSTTEVENLRSTLTEQLFENIYECMICIIKIEYVSYFYINKFIYDSLFFFLSVEIRKSGHVIYVIKCFI